jgi:hypothetical protein
MACSRYCIASTKLASGLATALPQHNPREERRRKHGCLACGTAWLQKRKPQTFRLEQAPGLLQLAEHRKYFRKLSNGTISNGYQVHWRIQNQAWFGLPQHRRRLIIVGSKGTFPLPPFPAATHGPPRNMRVVRQPAINPHTNLAKVVTTSGKENAHPSGKRASTVRELAAFQGFPLDLRCKHQYKCQKKKKKKTVRRQQCGFAYVGRPPTTPACWTRKRKCWRSTTSLPRRNTCQYRSTSRQTCLISSICLISPARSDLILRCLSSRGARHPAHVATHLELPTPPSPPPGRHAILDDDTEAAPLVPWGELRSGIPLPGQLLSCYRDGYALVCRARLASLAP